MKTEYMNDLQYLNDLQQDVDRWVAKMYRLQLGVCQQTYRPYI
jgi:hypothetical protein